MENEDTRLQVGSILDQGNTSTDWKGDTFYFPFEPWFEVAQKSGVLILSLAILV